MSEDTEFPPNILCTTEDAFEHFQATSMVEEEEFITLSDIVSPEPQVGQFPSNFGEIPFDNEVVLSSNCDDQFYDFGSGPVEIDLNQANNETFPDQNADTSTSIQQHYPPPIQQTELQDQSLPQRPKRKSKNKSFLNMIEPLPNGNTPENTLNTENEATILQNKPKRVRKPKQQLLTQSETIAAFTPSNGNKVSRRSRKRKSDKSAFEAPLESVKPVPVKRGRTKKTSNTDTVDEPLKDPDELSNTVPFQVNPADEISSELVPSAVSPLDEVYSDAPQPDVASSDNNMENFHSKSTSKRGRSKKIKSEQVENTENVNTSNSEVKNKSGSRRGRKKTNKAIKKEVKQEPEASEDDEWDTIPLTTLRNQNDLMKNNEDPNSQVSENEVKEDLSLLNNFHKTDEGPYNEPVANSEISSNIKIIENVVISSSKTSNENQFVGDSNIDSVGTEEAQPFLPSDPTGPLDMLEEQLEPISNSTANESNENVSLENSLLVEDTSKRPKRSKAKKTFQYENESDEDPFANMGSSDDEPISKRKSRYHSDDEYRPDKHIKTQDISSDPSDSDIDDVIEDKVKHKRKKVTRKSENLNKSPKKGSNKSPQKNIPTVTTIKPTVIDDDDDIEFCLESSVIKSGDVKEPTEFENFIAKKIQGTNIQIKKVSPNASSLSNHLEIPVLNADAKTSYEKSSQTNIQEYRNTSVQTSNPYEIKMKDKVNLTSEQSEQACEFLKSIVQTTSELGQLMTQKSEDFISKKINTSNVVDTLRMDYCVNKSFLLLKLAKHNIDQMEKDLSSKYEEFLKSTGLLRYREEPKKILAREKDNDSDCEIVEEPVSKPVKPKFNPKTVFLNKELSIKIAKKPPMASAKQKNKTNIKLPNRNEVWISDTVMVKKVKPTQSFLAQDSRNKKPPDCYVTEKMVNDFFKAYNSSLAATLCAPYITCEWLYMNKPIECRYFFVKDEKETSSGSDTDLFINNISNPTPGISNFNNDLKVETNQIGPLTPATLSTLCIQIITNKMRLCKNEVIDKSTSGEFHSNTNLQSPNSLKQLSLKILNCAPASTSMTNICKTNTIASISKDLSKVKSLKKLCLTKIEKILSTHHVTENCQKKLEKNGMTVTSVLHISEPNQEEKLYRNKFIVQNECLIRNDVSSLKKLCVNHIRNIFNYQLCQNMYTSTENNDLKLSCTPVSTYEKISPKNTIESLLSMCIRIINIIKNDKFSQPSCFDNMYTGTENNDLKLSCTPVSTYEKISPKNTIESLLSMCIRIINIIKNDKFSQPSISSQAQPSETTNKARRQTILFSASKNNNFKKTQSLSECLKDLQNDQDIYKSETNFEESTKFSSYYKVNSLFSISLRAIQQIQTIHIEDKLQSLKDYKVPESPSLVYVEGLTQIQTIHFEEEDFELPESPPLECSFQGVTYDPLTLQYLTLENVKSLLQISHENDLCLENPVLAPNATFEVKRLADISGEIISATTANEVCASDDASQGATEGLTINSVNTMSEEAFHNIGRDNVEDDDTDFYEDDDVNEDFTRENSDTEVHSWAAKVQMQELRSCFVPNQDEQNLTVAENSSTINITNDTQIKVEPTEDPIENLVDSSIVKTEPIQQCDEMTIIPDSIITKLESYETGVDNAHKGYDVETFESFVSRNNMMNDQAFNQGTQKVRRQHEPDYSNEYDPSMSLLIPQAFEPTSVVTAKGSLMENSSSDEETANKKGKKKLTKRIKGKNTKKAEKELPVTKEKALPVSALNEVAILTRKMRERIRQEEKKIQSSDSDDEVLAKINKDRKDPYQSAPESKSSLDDKRCNDSTLTGKMREKKTDALNSDENIQAKQKGCKEIDELITDIKSSDDEKQYEDTVLTRRMQEKIKSAQSKNQSSCSEDENVLSKTNKETDNPAGVNKSKSDEMKCNNAIITRKMREKMKLEEKNDSSPVLEDEKIVSKTTKGRIDPNKSQTINNSEEEEIQCNNVDSTEQVENDSFEKDNQFTGFSALDQVDISNYHKYVRCIYDKIVQSDDDKNKQASLSEDDARSGSPLINYDDPAEMVECEPSLPIFSNDDDNDSKKVRRKNKKGDSKETLKSVNHVEDTRGQKNNSQNQDKMSNETTTKPVAQLERPKEDNRKYKERDGWKCYPLDEEETKLFQDVKIVLKKLSDNFVATYNKYQEITDRNEEDADVNRLINLNTLNRATKSSIKKTKGKAQADGKSHHESKDNNDSCASLTASEDERSNDNEELPTCIPRQSENHLAKNLLMNDSESDGEGPKIKQELNDAHCEPSTRSKKKIKVKESNVDPDSFMLTADKMMNKELNLLHAPVILGNEVPESDSKGTSTKSKHKSGPRSSRERVKNDEDSSSEEEKQWVNTKEKLLKRMGKKIDTSTADDAKRVKLVNEFIERRGDAQINDTRKRRRGGNRRQSIRKRLAREKEMRVLSYELFGQPLDPNVLGGPRHTAPAQSYFKGRRNIRKVIDKKSLARSTVIANMEEFERKKRIGQRNAQLKQVLGHKDDLSVIVVNNEVCLEYSFEENRPIVSVHPFFTNVMKTHQYEGVKFMWDACFESVAQMEAGHPGGGCILAHCMGLGKTLQVLALLHTVLTHPRLGIQRILVCCPLSTVLNWVDEIHKWIGPVTKKIKVFELSKLKKTYERAYQLEDWYNEGGIFIIGYELFRSLTTLDPELDDIRPTIVNKIRSALLDPGPDIVICDEGHLLKNDSSVLAMAMSRVITKRRIVLTGTPMQNNLREYYCMVNFVKPNLLGTYAEYSNRFENPIMNGQHRDSQEEDIKLMKQRTHILHKVLEGCLQRMEASVLYPYLPKKYEYTLFIPLTDVQWDLYKHYIHHYCNQKALKQNILKDFHVLQKIWSHPRVLHNFQLKSRDDVDRNMKAEKLEDDLAHEDLTSEDIKPPATDTWWLQYLEEGNKLESLQSSKKFVAVFSLLEECVALGDKVLLFSTSLITLDAMEYFLKKILNWNLGHDYYRLDGSVPAEVRQKWCREFNAEENVHTKMFLISTRAGCLGLNMVAANRVILFDTSWNPAHDIQSIFRVYRFGQKKDCYIYRLVALGTMEQKIYERSVTKQAVACRVVDEQQIDRHYNMAELTELYKFDEAGGGLTLELATCSRDGPLYRAARCGSLRAVREHDSLLRGDSEQPLHEHEMRAAWDQFQLEQTTKQMQNDLISSLAIHATLEQPEQQPPLQPPIQPDVPIKEEDTNKEDSTTNTTKGKRGRPKGKSGGRKGVLLNDIPQSEPEHLLPDNPPIEQMQPTEPEQNKDTNEDEQLTTKILELLMKNNFDGRPEDLSQVVANIRSVIQSGQTSQNLASTIATALTANDKTVTANNDAEPPAEHNRPTLKVYKRGRPKKTKDTIEDPPPLDEPSTSADNTQTYYGRRRAALNAEKQIVTMNYDDDWVNDDAYSPGGADEEWSDPTDVRKKQDDNKSKKDSITAANIDEMVAAIDAVQVKIEKQTEPGTSSMQTYSLLSDDEDDESLATTKSKNAAPTKSKQPLKPDEIKKEGDWPEPISLHPSLLNNKNFIKIVAHTFLEGNPLLDEDAAFLAAQYTVDKAKKDLEANGLPIISGPIYNIAVKVLGIDILEKLHKTNPVPKPKPQETPDNSAKDAPQTAVKEPTEVPQDSFATRRRPGPKSAVKSAPPVEPKQPPKKAMLKPKNTIDLMDYPKPKPSLQAKNTIDLMDYPMQHSTAPTDNTTDLMDYPIMQRLSAHTKNTIELMDYPMQKQTPHLLSKMGTGITAGPGTSVVPVTIRFNKDGKMIGQPLQNEEESILPDDNDVEEAVVPAPTPARPPPVVLNTLLRGTSKPLILKKVKSSGPLPVIASVQSAAHPPIPKLVISAGKLMPQGSEYTVTSSLPATPVRPVQVPVQVTQPPPQHESQHTICIDSDEEESITPNLEVSKPARRVALKSTAKQTNAAPVPVPGSLRAIHPTSGAVLTPETPEKIQLSSFPGHFQTINRDGKKYMMVPADHLKMSTAGAGTPLHVVGHTADAVQQLEAVEPAGPNTTSAPKLKKTVCKPGDIIRLTKSGKVEILNRQEPPALTKETLSDLMPNMTTIPTAASSAIKLKPIPKPRTMTVSTPAPSSTPPKQVPIQPKPTPAPKLPNPARRVSVVSSSSSDDSRASSPVSDRESGDPLSVLKDVVIINAENDGYSVSNEGSSRDSLPTPKTNKPELTPIKLADTARSRPSRLSKSKEPANKVTASVANENASTAPTTRSRQVTQIASHVPTASTTRSRQVNPTASQVSTGSTTRSRQVTPTTSQVNRTSPSKINTATAKPTASIDLTDLDFDTPSTSSTVSKQQTKKPTTTTFRPVKEVTKVTGVSKNIVISIAGNTPTVKNIASHSSKTNVSATPAPKLQPDFKKRPAPQVNTNVKRKKTEPMTLQDFNIDDIDDIIELD